MPKQVAKKKLGIKHYLVYELFPLIVLAGFIGGAVAARAAGLLPEFVQ